MISKQRLQDTNVFIVQVHGLERTLSFYMSQVSFKKQDELYPLVSGLEKNFRWAGKGSRGWGEGPLRRAKCLKSLKT